MLLWPVLAILLTSCLKKGIDQNLPAFSDAEITDIFFEYRYEDGASHSPDGSNLIRVVQLPVSEKQFKLKEDNSGAATDSVIATVTVPAADNFTPESEWDNVDAGMLVCKTNISTAARVDPVDDAPVMGTPGDYSVTRQYRVTAADGVTQRIWTIRINLVK